MNSLDKLAMWLAAAVAAAVIAAVIVIWGEFCSRLSTTWRDFIFWTPFASPFIWAIAYLAWRMLP